MTESPSFRRGWGGPLKIMEKKKYIAPSMEIAEIEMVSMLAASIGVSDETTEDDAVMSNRRRGTWGNLWATDEE